MTSTSTTESSTAIVLDLKKARRHCSEFVLKDAKGQPFTVCKSKTRDLGINGVGIELYFVFLKQMIILFTVLSVMAFPVLVINLSGGYLHEMDKTSPFEASTIANQRSISRSDIVQGKGVNKHKALMNTTVFLDLAYCIVYVAMLLAFEWYNCRRVRRTKNLTVKDFSVMAELRIGNVAEGELKEFFEKYGPVHECCVAEVYGKELQQLISYANTKKAILAGEKRKVTSFQKFMNTVLYCGKNTTEKKRDKLKKKCAEMLKSIKQVRESGSRTETKAFIVFEDLAARQKCLENPKPTFKSTELHMASPSNPGELFWENFGARNSKWKLFCIYFILWVSLVISLVIISIVEYYENRLPTYSRCLDFAPLNSTASFVPSNETQVLCFCGGAEEGETRNFEDYAEFCNGYWTYFVQIWIVRLAGSGVIALVNMLLKYAIMGSFYL